jgi:Flp pilus assembly secretin CpaC
MRTRHWIIIASATLALIAVLSLPSLTLARGPNGGTGNGPGGMMGGQQQSLVAVAAQVLGIPQADLIAQLQSGKTIKDVAGDKTGAIVDAFVKARADQMAAQVSAGRLTQAQADQMLVTMRANITAQLSAAWTARGTGMGMGDANGDGTCDTTGAGMRSGTGAGMGHGRMGMGRNSQ